MTVTTKVDRSLVSVQVSGSDLESLYRRAIAASDAATRAVDRANI